MRYYNSIEHVPCPGDRHAAARPESGPACAPACLRPQACRQAAMMPAAKPTALHTNEGARRSPTVEPCSPWPITSLAQTSSCKKHSLPSLPSHGLTSPCPPHASAVYHRAPTTLAYPHPRTQQLDPRRPAFPQPNARARS